MKAYTVNVGEKITPIENKIMERVGRMFQGRKNNYYCYWTILEQWLTTEISILSKNF